jgi:hypothetical protein
MAFRGCWSDSHLAQAGQWPRRCIQGKIRINEASGGQVRSTICDFSDASPLNRATESPYRLGLTGPLWREFARVMSELTLFNQARQTFHPESGFVDVCSGPS